MQQGSSAQPPNSPSNLTQVMSTDDKRRDPRSQHNLPGYENILQSSKLPLYSKKEERFWARA